MQSSPPCFDVGLAHRMTVAGRLRRDAAQHHLDRAGTVLPHVTEQVEGGDAPLAEVRGL
jgi:hypothetical protein